MDRTPPPNIDPALLSRLAAELDGLQRQVGALSHTVAMVQRSVTPVAWQPPAGKVQPGQVQPGQVQRPPVAPAPPAPGPVPPGYPRPQQAYPGNTQWRPMPPAPPRQPWWEREGMVSRLLAVAGAAVTLIGV